MTSSPSNLTATMRAAQWRSISGGIEKNLRTTNDARLPTTTAAKDQTLVKVAYASLNHLDYKVAEMMPFGNLLLHRSKPATPGLDFSGTVVSTSNLSNLQPGQRVFGRTESPAGGTLAEYVMVSNKNGVAALPAGVTLRDASCVGICGVTAVQTLVPYLKKPGSRVLINGGSGGVGTFAIQVAKTLGCANITVVCSGANAELCRSLGADDVIDYQTTENVVTTLKQNGQQYDHILDTVFSDPNLYWQCHHYLAPQGRYVCIGLPLGFKTFKSLLAIYLLPRLLGGGKRRFSFHSVTANTEHSTQVAQWMAEGKVKAIVEEEFQLEDAARAYAKLKAGRTRGKIVVCVSGEGGS